ncbi:efflux RND transporter periplasmic adaptor subunit [Emticicia sp.]|uniref:efflux RND transporter periplasmic adaptor subunit n=1 Tax=Emticicia sp. TaxID=1930953 RepID=UPI0037533C9F
MKVNYTYTLFVFTILLFTACTSREKQDHTQHNQSETTKPDTMKMPDEHSEHNQMEMNKPDTSKMPDAHKGHTVQNVHNVQLESLLKPTNEYVISSIPVTTIKKDKAVIDINAIGKVEYDTRMIGTIAARISGRIEKLYVRYKYQPIEKGQKIMDIYSPELLTAQQNLLFLFTNDSDNTSLIQAAKDRLLLLGMSLDQLQNVIQYKVAIYSIGIYSNYKGHLHNATSKTDNMNAQTTMPTMGNINPSSELLDLKEGMYVKSGQNLFTIYNPAKAWVALNIYTDKQGLVKKGQNVKIIPETAPTRSFQGRIDFIEPFYRKENNTTTVRVYFDNSDLKLPIGSQVRGLLTLNTDNAYWLPIEAVTSLGINKIVFLKQADGFIAQKITTGITVNNKILMLTGLSEKDSIAVNASYLMDSESFIKIK